MFGSVDSLGESHEGQKVTEQFNFHSMAQASCHPLRSSGLLLTQIKRR